ncbi:hypothetical protein ACWEQ8_44660, partial [Streptomyces noursei]
MKKRLLLAGYIEITRLTPKYEICDGGRSARDVLAELFELLGPAVIELRLSAFKTHRGVTLPLGPLTLLSGDS